MADQHVSFPTHRQVTIDEGNNYRTTASFGTVGVPVVILTTVSHVTGKRDQIMLGPDEMATLIREWEAFGTTKGA